MKSPTGIRSGNDANEFDPIAARSLGCEFQPTLEHASVPRSTFQAAGLSVAGSPLPQALIPLRQRLACRASSAPADILLRTTPESVPTNSAVAQPTIAVVVELARGPMTARC